MEFYSPTLRSRTPGWKCKIILDSAGVPRIALLDVGVQPVSGKFSPKRGGIGKNDLSLVRQGAEPFYWAMPPAFREGDVGSQDAIGSQYGGERVEAP